MPTYSQSGKNSAQSSRSLMAVSSRLLVPISSSLLLLFFTVSAHAEEASAAQQSSETLFKWINFAIVAGAIIWFSLKEGPAFFRGRTESIGSAIAKATEAKKQADQQLHDAETKLANLQKEIAELRTTALRESAAEAERIRNLTVTDVHKIDAAAKTEIEAAGRAARLELKALAANLAVSGAESLLTQQLTPAAQESLINNFVKTLDGRPN